MDVKAFTQAYRDELKGLNEADKATINMLTMLAEDNKQHAQAIVETIEMHLRECNPRARLPALYLMDSIIKNLKEPYISLFSKHIDLMFGRVWDSTMAKERERLSKLCKLWDGYLAPDVLARVRSRMTASTTGQQAPAPVTVLQQPHPVLQQQAPPQHMQPHVVQHQPALQPHPGFPPHHPGLQPAQHIVLMQPPPPQQQQGTVFVIGPHGQFVPVGAPALPPPQLIPMQAIPQHMVAGGLPPVSPAHPGWPPHQQQLAPRPMQPVQQPGRSPAYPPVSPALVSASPHHRTSPQHMSAPGSSVRSGSHEEQAAHIAASLDTLLQGLTRTGYLNDPALKATTFDPTFIKKEHKGVIALLHTASERTRARFKDIQFQHNKRRRAAAASAATHSRSWYLPVNSWITGTTVLQDDAQEEDEEAEGEEGPAPPPTVDADPSQTKCAISHEPFDSFYDQDRETWVCRGVVRLQGAEAERHGVPDGSIVKVECLAEADLGSSPAALAAAAAAGAAAMAAGEDEADLAAAALAAPAAGQQQQQQQQEQQQQQQPATAAEEEQKPPLLAQVKEEPQEEELGGGGGSVDVKMDPAAAAAAAAAAGVKQQPQDGSHQQVAAAAGLKREAAEDGTTPSKKQRVSPEPPHTS